jgi:hypothetical protein
LSAAPEGNIVAAPNAFDRRRVRADVVAWIGQMGCSHSVTLNANRALTRDKVTKMFGCFCLELDRACYGRKNVHAIPASDRLRGIAFIEHPETNIHLHAALRLADWWPKKTLISLHVTIDRIWRRITAGAGSTMVKEVCDAGWGYYITKDADLREQQFLLPSDYHPQP